ncbi:MAG: sulfatase [Planctomycetales bacterium]|nr:sulfatase [Planctomycetales bacterium]
MIKARTQSCPAVLSWNVGQQFFCAALCCYFGLIAISDRTEATETGTGRSPPNILLICVDDLRPELRCFGVDYIHSPNIDRLAAAGRMFTHHYVQAPTCGASRFALLTGRYARSGDERGNEAFVFRAKNREIASVSMPEWFRGQGYATVAIGKVSHRPGGLYGNHWADKTLEEMPGAWDRNLMPTGAWQHPEGAMHGLAHGEIRRDAGKMDIFQSAERDDTIYPDGLTAAVAIEQLELLAADAKQPGDSRTPFFLAVGFLKPHLPFGAPARYMEHYASVQRPAIPHPNKPAGKTTWHGSAEFMKYNRWGRDPRSDTEFADLVRRHYAACVTYSDALVGQLLDKLQALQLAKDTIVVLWGDHGWHLGEHGIWGKHSLFEESLRSPLIISAPGMIERGTPMHAVVESIDIFPTLCESCELPLPEGLDGQPLPLEKALDDPSSDGGTAISYQSNRETIRTANYRLVRHRRNQQIEHVELYDMAKGDATTNIAGERPDVVADLLRQLNLRMPMGPRQ